MKRVLRIVSALLASVMLTLMLCSCKNTSYICTLDGVSCPVGPYAFYAYTTRDDYQTQLAYYGYTDFASALLSDYDDNGTKVYNHINSEVQENYKRYLFIKTQFQELGLTLSDDDLTAIDSAMKTNWVEKYGETGFTDICRTLGVTSSEFEEIISRPYKYNALLNYYFGEGGKYEITDSEMLNNYNTNYSRFRYIAVSKLDPDTSETLSTDELIVKKAKVDEALAKASAGEDFAGLIKAYSEDFVKVTDDMSDDEKTYYEEQNRKNTEDGIVVDKDGVFDYYSYYYSYTMDSNIVNKVFSMNDGDIALVELSSSFWILQRLDKNENESFYESKKSLIYSALSSPIIEELFAGWQKNSSITFNTATVSKYDPRKINSLFILDSDTSSGTTSGSGS